MRPFLIYTSAGKHNNIHRWVKTQERNYDLWVTNYSDEPGLLKNLADYHNDRKGAKFPNFLHIVQNHRAQLEQYKAIMVADDDIIISPQKLERLFTQLVNQNLWVITPAYSRFGKITHDTTERNLTSRYRYTNFAEMTCPVFRTDKLLSFMDIYDPALPAYGQDWWYLNFFNDKSQKKIVISDENYCINPRDAHKATQVREIDKHISQTDRHATWETKKADLGIGSFTKRIYKSEPQSAVKIMRGLPIYGLEVLIDWGLRANCLKPVKRVAKRFIAGK